VRVSAKADYAVRATAALAAMEADGPVKAIEIAEDQGIPVKFLQGVLNELRVARIVRSARGPDGGFMLARPPEEITLADVFRAMDGPLINVRDESLTDLDYPGAAALLREVWMAARSSLRNVLEQVTLADLANGVLPEDVLELAELYQSDPRHPR
jgi:Rrf2 family protein